MKKIIGVLGLAVILGACSLGGGSATPATSNSADINVTLSGTLAPGSGGTYTLQQGQGKSTSVHDGNATLSTYVGKKVTVTGQYSGTTLYVDEVK